MKYDILLIFKVLRGRVRGMSLMLTQVFALRCRGRRSGACSLLTQLFDISVQS